ncbi:hypothetical protein D6779_06275 [Candidatus Parcubacteria bacterium]|nr:MAG: hypothetical protein D6779_06275 [Candidatus Parcubacteria bacterium]
MYKTRKKYSKEFKENAVRLMMESELSPTEIARDLGIHRSILHRWRKELISPGANPQAQGKDKELLRLEKEIAELKLEREILKKALGIFSKHPK